jgi:hypothetical protein
MKVFRFVKYNVISWSLQVEKEKESLSPIPERLPSPTAAGLAF